MIATPHQSNTLNHAHPGVNPSPRVIPPETPTKVKAINVDYNAFHLRSTIFEIFSMSKPYLVDFPRLGVISTYCNGKYHYHLTSGFHNPLVNKVMFVDECFYDIVRIEHLLSLSSTMWMQVGNVRLVYAFLKIQ